MAKEDLTLKTTKRSLATREIPSAAALQEILEVSDAALLTQKINEIGKLL